jgi:hypothetical protein
MANKYFTFNNNVINFFHNKLYTTTITSRYSTGVYYDDQDGYIYFKTYNGVSFNVSEAFVTINNILTGDVNKEGILYRNNKTDPLDTLSPNGPSVILYNYIDNIYEIYNLQNTIFKNSDLEFSEGKFILTTLKNVISGTLSASNGGLGGVVQSKDSGFLFKSSSTSYGTLSDSKTTFDQKSYLIYKDNKYDSLAKKQSLLNKKNTYIYDINSKWYNSENANIVKIIIIGGGGGGGGGANCNSQGDPAGAGGGGSGGFFEYMIDGKNLDHISFVIGASGSGGSGFINNGNQIGNGANGTRGGTTSATIKTKKNNYINISATGGWGGSGGEYFNGTLGGGGGGGDPNGVVGGHGGSNQNVALNAVLPYLGITINGAKGFIGRSLDTIMGAIVAGGSGGAGTGKTTVASAVNIGAAGQTAQNLNGFGNLFEGSVYYNGVYYEYKTFPLNKGGKGGNSLRSNTWSSGDAGNGENGSYGCGGGGGGSRSNAALQADNGFGDGGDGGSGGTGLVIIKTY